MHPHEKQLTDNSIAVTDLAEKTQKKIAKFAAEKDEEKRDALDESIFGDVEDFIEAINKKAEAEKKKASHAAAKAEADKGGAEAEAAKKKALAGAATGKTPEEIESAEAAKKKPRTMFDTIYGR